MGKLQKVIVPGAAVLSIAASVAMAQAARSLRGKIENVASQTLVVTARDGTMTNVMLADEVHVFKLKQASLADLEHGSVVGTTAIGQMSGSEKAVEIYIFPDEPRHEPNVPAKVVGRENEVLSYTEGSVLDNENQVLTIKHTDGEKRIAMPANVRIVMLVPATVADIKPGQYFLVPNDKPTSLGTLASTIIVGSNGVDFAM
ncbi:MAG: hypothetical protein JO283_16720 [Bradyrhizobium sp.]|nr:hypothetical protein [Bradyrhizobium sp.]